MKHVMRSRLKKIFSPLYAYSIMLVLGVLAGSSDISAIHSFTKFIAEVFVNMFKCISLPVIALSIIVTLSQYSKNGSLNTLWRRSMKYTFGTTLVASFVSFALYCMVAPQNLTVSNTVPIQLDVVQHSYWDFVGKLVPSSFIQPFIEHQVISVLFIALLIGAAIPNLGDERAKETVIRFFQGLHGLIMILTQWLIKLIPIALFGFIATTVKELRGEQSLIGLFQYLTVIVLANLVQAMIILPLWLKYKGIEPIAAMRGMMPALSLAFFSKSSIGTLPLTMETIEKNLKVRPSVSRFILPICTSLNMNGCAAFIFTTVIYIMQNNGIELSIPLMLLWVFVSVIAAIGNAGVPMGCFFLSASLLSGMDIPINLLSIILPFYGLIDMLESSVNVWSDACVTTVVDASVQGDLVVDVVQDATA